MRARVKAALDTAGIAPASALGAGRVTCHQQASTRHAATFYEAVGGEETFRRLVARFYEAVATDPILRPLYPEEDLGPAEERLRMFLIQYWGGPGTYSELRGHPRLRMRHVRLTLGGRTRPVADASADTARLGGA